jgi:flagellin
MSILNNLSALTAENNLNATQANLQSTLTKLSSGLKINSGSDDAAGLSIANGMNANIAALTQSVQNATNGTGLLQTADGALSEVTTLLNRAVTLATEGSTSGITTSQATALNTEFSNIMTEINTIGSQTKFNAGTVFQGATNGSNNTVNVFMGDGTTGTHMQTSVTIDNLSSQQLGLGQTASNTISGSQNASNGDQVTVGTTTYTLATAASFATDQAAGTANVIAIGGTLAQTMQNLAEAINGSGTAGVNYTTGTAANSSAYASNVSSTGVTVTALTSGLTGNNINTTATSGTLGWNNTQSTIAGNGTAADLTGDTVTIGAQTYTFGNSAAVSGATGSSTGTTVLLGGTVQASLANLAAAINGTGVAGTTYATGTVVNASASAGTLGGSGETASLAISVKAGQPPLVPTSVTGTSAAWSNQNGPFLNNTMTGGSGTALDLNNTTDAQAALAAINTAISTVASMRGTIGATVNQLQAASNVMNNQVQNLTSAASGITDADIGKTVADMSKYNTLSQTGIAALQQANQASQAVLKLLQ